MHRKIKNIFVGFVMSVLMLTTVAYAGNIDSGTLEYNNVYVYVNGSITFMDANLWFQDKVWASVRMYGRDIDLIADPRTQGTQYDVVKNGSNYMTGTLYVNKTTDSISEKTCGSAGTSATLTLYDRADRKTLTLTADD